MGKALNAFYEAHRKFGPKRWSGKAADAVSTAVRGESLQATISYLKRCHAFRNMTKETIPKALEKWMLPDGSRDDILISATALAPLRMDGKFRLKEFQATAEKIARETSSYER